MESNIIELRAGVMVGDLDLNYKAGDMYYSNHYYDHFGDCCTEWQRVLLISVERKSGKSWFYIDDGGAQIYSYRWKK